MQTIRILHGFRSEHIPVRAYECPYGNGWHLTSKGGWS